MIYEYELININQCELDACNINIHKETISTDYIAFKKNYFSKLRIFTETYKNIYIFRRENICHERERHDVR